MGIAKKIVSLLNKEVPTEILIKRGMKIGNNFSKQQGCFIDPTHCFLITIGDNVTMSIRVTVLAHDASTKSVCGYTKIGQVKIGNNVFIGANTTILPGVTIGDNVIIGAGSIVTHDIPSRSVVAGVPAKVVHTISEYKENVLNQITPQNMFGEEYKMGFGLDENKKNEILEQTKSGIAFIK